MLLSLLCLLSQNLIFYNYVVISFYYYYNINILSKSGQVQKHPNYNRQRWNYEYDVLLIVPCADFFVCSRLERHGYTPSVVQAHF